MEITNESDLYEALKSFVEMMYFRYLAINPKDRKVIICESPFYSTMFRNTLIRVFFSHFDVSFVIFEANRLEQTSSKLRTRTSNTNFDPEPSNPNFKQTLPLLQVPALLVVPQNLMALMTLMIPTGLVIDIGQQEAVCIPVINGVTLIGSSKFTNLGAKQLHRRIKEELIKYKAQVRIVQGVRSVEESDLNEKIIEDIKLKTCFVCPFKRSSALKESLVCEGEQVRYSIESGCPPDVRYPIYGDRILTVPGLVREAACELFFEQQGEELNLVRLVLDTILDCPMDARKALISNLVLIGGTSMLAGLKHRLQQELIHAVTNCEPYKHKIYCKEFKFHQLPCKENYVCWLGASIFGWTDAMNLRAITRDQYLKSNGQVIKDWSDWNGLERGLESVKI